MGAIELTGSRIPPQLWKSSILAFLEVVLGAFVGYSVGESLLLSNARTDLKAYSHRLLIHADQLANESNDLLSALNTSTLPPCSDAYIAFMQGITHQSRYIRDAARIEKNAFRCSARLGLIHPPIPITNPPDLVTKGGTSIYRNNPKSLGGGFSNFLTQQNSAVVVDEQAFFEAAESPMHYGTFVVNPETRQAVPVYGSSLGLSFDQVATQQQGKLTDVLYSVACSPNFPVCYVASITRKEVFAADQNVLLSMAIAGSVVGLLFSLLTSLYFRRQRTLGNQLRLAIRRREFSLLYQPIVSLPNRRIVGAEALLRWHTSTGESIPPDVFIPIAEQNGLIAEITRHVLSTATTQLSTLCHRYPGFFVSINIAASDLSDPAFLRELDHCIQTHRLPPSTIAIELTERSTGDHSTIQEALKALRQRGHPVMIDDFGTGYSSLAYLHNLQIDGIKIDRSFTATIGTEAVTAAIVPQIFAMADALNLAITVEGIETLAQTEWFQATGRPLRAQGWYFSKPIPANELTRLVTAITPTLPTPK